MSADAVAQHAARQAYDIFLAQWQHNTCWHHNWTSLQFGRGKRMLQKQYMFPSIHEPIKCLAGAGGLIYMSTSSSFYSMTVRGMTCKHNGVVANTTNTYVDKYNKLWLLSECTGLFRPSNQTNKEISVQSVKWNRGIIISRCWAERIVYYLEGWRYLALWPSHLYHRQYCANINGIAEGRVGQRFFDVDIDKDGLLRGSPITDKWNLQNLFSQARVLFLSDRT